MKFTLTSLCLAFSCLLSAQNVGIGTASPAYPLDVNGSIRSSGNIYSSGFIGVGTTSPIYGVQINNASLAIYNTTDSKFWVMNYSPVNNGLSILENGSSNRLFFENGGFVGIGTTAPVYRLHVAGSVGVNGTLYVGSSTNIEGSLTVNDGKGIMRNATGSAQLKYYTRETAFTAVLAGDALSAEGSFGFATAGFTTVPVVMPADIVSTGGTSGQLYRVQMIIYGCTTTSCKVRLLNTSPSAVNYDVTWNVICIGN